MFENDFWGLDECGEFRGHEARLRGHRKDATRLLVLEIGRNVCFGKGGGSAPSPDPQIGQAARENVQLGHDWLDFAKVQFNESNKRQDVTDALSSKVVDQQIATQDEANKWAREDRNRTKTVFQPVEDKFIKTASEYDSPAKQAEAAAAARADVLSADAAQSQSNARQMASMGIAPGSGRFVGIQRAQDTNAALAAAGAQNAARQMVRDRGLALKADAINMGKGLASSTAAGYNIGINAGNSAVGNNAAANQSFIANNGIMANGFSGAIGANQSAGGMLNGLYSAQTSAYNAQQSASAQKGAGIAGGVGAVVGAAIMAF